MKRFFVSLLIAVAVLPSCLPRAGVSPDPTPIPPTVSPTPSPTRTAPPPTRTPTTVPPTPSPTAEGVYRFQPRTGVSPGTAILALEAIRGTETFLVLADPAQKALYEVHFPAAARFATPFLSGLSPDSHYFVFFEGGWLETLYEVEHLRASEPDLSLNVLDLYSSEIVLSTPLLNPEFPANLAQPAETIKDEWHFTFRNAAFSEVVAATQEYLLDHIRMAAWSPDSSLLAFAAQIPGPTSDLYLYHPASGTARHIIAEPGHFVEAAWAPDSSVLIMESSLYDRHAREDATFLLTREGTLVTSFTSQVWRFTRWHDSTRAYLYGATDAGENFDLKLLSAVDGTSSLLWDGSYEDIEYTPDLSTFLLSSNMPNSPSPPQPGLFLGDATTNTLQMLSPGMGWNAAYWGSERFAFAASSREAGIMGVTQNGEMEKIHDGYWQFDPSPGGRFLAAYNRIFPSNHAGMLPGLRIFDSRGKLLEIQDYLQVTCVEWDATSTTLAYQVEGSLYLWNATDGSTSTVPDLLNPAECALKWVNKAR